MMALRNNTRIKNTVSVVHHRKASRQETVNGRSIEWIEPSKKGEKKNIKDVNNKKKKRKKERN
jgi:hypothetical protein